MFHENTPWSPSTNRLSSRGLDQSAAVRNERGCSNPRSNASTLGAAVEKMPPVLPSAHAAGALVGLPAYELQSGTGAAGPTHAIVRVDVGNPVCATASESRFADP